MQGTMMLMTARTSRTARAAAAILALQIAFIPAVAHAGPLTASAGRALQQVMADETASWKAMVEKLEAGAFVTVRLKDGRRQMGTVIRAGDDTFTFKAHTRIPVAATEIAYRDVSTIERTGRPWSPGKKVAVSVGIGSAAFVILAAMVAASLD